MGTIIDRKEIFRYRTIINSQNADSFERKSFIYTAEPSNNTHQCWCDWWGYSWSASQKFAGQMGTKAHYVYSISWRIVFKVSYCLSFIEGRRNLESKWKAKSLGEKRLIFHFILFEMNEHQVLLEWPCIHLIFSLVRDTNIKQMLSHINIIYNFRMLKALIVPLLVASITSAIGSLDLSMSGKIARR